MILPPFDMKYAEYDDWNDFFIPYGPDKNFHQSGRFAPFIQFKSDEMIMNKRTYDPDTRKFYKELGLRIVSSTDDDCPTFYRNGDTKPIPKSHLNLRGQQVLVIDVDKGMAVGVRPDKRGANTDREHMPQRFLDRDVAVYWAGKDRAPVGHPIFIEYDYPLTKEQKEHLRNIQHACETWAQMSTDPEVMGLWHRKKNTINPTFPFKTTIDMLGVLSYQFADLSDAQRVQIALEGMRRGTKIEQHNCLSVI